MKYVLVWCGNTQHEKLYIILDIASMHAISRKIQRLTLTGFMVMGLAACTDDFDKLNDPKLATIEAEWALPVLDTRLTAREMVDLQENEEQLLVYPDGRLYYFYEDSVQSALARDIIELPAQTSPDIPFNFGNPTNNPVVRETQISLFFEGVQPKRVDLRRGLLEVGFRSSINTPYTLDIVFPSSETISGTPFTTRIDIPAAENGAVRVENQIVMPPTSLFFERPFGQVVLLPIRLIAVFDDPSQVGAMPMTANFRLSQMEYSFIQGLFGSIELIDPSLKEVPITLFDRNIRREDVRFEDPRVRFTISNGFGFPAFTATSFLGARSENGTTRLLGPGVSALNPLRMPAATIIGSGVAPETEPGRTVRLIDATNTLNNGVNGIKDVLGDIPQEVVYDTRASISSGRGFVRDSSRLKVNVGLEIPLDGSVKRLVFRDTIGLEIPDDRDEPGVEGKSAKVRFIVNNGFPVEAGVQVFFKNDRYQTVDTLFRAGDEGFPRSPNTGGILVGAASVNANGRVTADGANETSAVITLDRERYERLRDRATVAITEVFMQTQDSEFEQPVVVEDDHQIRLRLGLRAKGSANVDQYTID